LKTFNLIKIVIGIVFFIWQRVCRLQSERARSMMQKKNRMTSSVFQW